jgi:hypothetical protein
VSKDPHNPRRLSIERVARVAMADIQPMSPATPGVPSDQRESVFIHSSICNRCGLHFTCIRGKRIVTGPRPSIVRSAGSTKASSRPRHDRVDVADADRAMEVGVPLGCSPTGGGQEANLHPCFVLGCVLSQSRPRTFVDQTVRKNPRAASPLGAPMLRRPGRPAPRRRADRWSLTRAPDFCTTRHVASVSTSLWPRLFLAREPLPSARGRTGFCIGLRVEYRPPLSSSDKTGTGNSTGGFCLRCARAISFRACVSTPCCDTPERASRARPTCPSATAAARPIPD